MLDIIGYDYIVNEKRYIVLFIEEGIKKVEKYFGVINLVDLENVIFYYYIIQVLKVYVFMKRDRDYVVKDG